MIDFNFDAEGYDAEADAKEHGLNDGGDFKALPAGTYQVELEEPRETFRDFSTEKGEGTMLNLQHRILGDHEGNFANRVIFDTLCLSHSGEESDDAVKQKKAKTALAIARRTVNDYCAAVGVKRIKGGDFTPLYGKAFAIVVGIKKDTQYGDEDGNVNVIKKVKPLGAAASSSGSKAAKPSWK